MTAEKTGWDYETILWRVSWVNIRMMLADAPKVVSVRKKTEPGQKILQGDELAKILGL